METILTLVLGILLISIFSFIFFRANGIYRLNNQIINLVIEYTKRHPDCKGLPQAEELFIPINKKLFSFKKLTIENWVNSEVIEKLKS